LHENDFVSFREIDWLFDEIAIIRSKKYAFLIPLEKKNEFDNLRWVRYKKITLL